MMWPIRKPLRAELLEMIDLADLKWPVTYSYLVQTLWGQSRQTICVDAPELEDQLNATRLLGILLWSMITAPAVSGMVRLVAVDYLPWKLGSFAPNVPIVPRFGDVPARPASRENSAQLVLLTGHGDKYDRRRFFLPGTPADWVADGLVTREGWEHLLPHATGMMMGLATPQLGSGMQWLIEYPGVVQPNGFNFSGTCFRRVTHVRVCHHTDKAPEVTGGL